MAVRTRLALFFGIALLSLLVSEIALRAFVIRDGRLGDRPLPPFGALPHPRQAAWLEQMQAELASGTQRTGAGVFDAELGWTNTPFFSERPEALCVSSLGARGRREYTPEIPTGVTRILSFGDSFTYCAEVADTESWQHQLEARRPEWELPNFGVGGYGTDQALLRMRRVLKRIEGDVLLMGINVENIARNVNRYRPIYHPRTAAAIAKPRFLLVGEQLELLPSPFQTRAELVAAVASGSVLEQLAQHEHWAEPPSLLTYSAIGQLFCGWKAYARRQPETLWSEARSEPFRVTLALLEAFHREASQGGAQLAAVVISQRQTDLGGERFWAPLCEALDARGIQWIDVSFALDSASSSGASLFQGGHLSARGNELTAQAVEAFLVERL